MMTKPEIMTESEPAMQVWMSLLSVAGPQERVLDVTSFALDDFGSLPFANHSAGIVTSYMGLHNYSDVLRMLQEMVRVCQPGGYVAMCDDMTPEDLDAAAYINAWHSRHNPAYQWAYAQGEWCELMQRAGLGPEAEQTLRHRAHFASWSTLSGIEPEVVAIMCQELFHAPPGVRDFLNPRIDGEDRYFDQVQGFWLGRKG